MLLNEHTELVGFEKEKEKEKKKNKEKETYKKG